jgi:hypothetical protein
MEHTVEHVLVYLLPPNEGYLALRGGAQGGARREARGTGRVRGMRRMARGTRGTR